MKPYGIPRNPELGFPDVADILFYGLASHTGHRLGKSGDYHPYIRSSGSKARTRRIWKGKARAEGKRQIRLVLAEMDE